MKATTIKTLLVTAVLTLATIFPIGETQTFKITILTSIVLFLFGLILTPIMQYNSLRNRLTIKKPKWSDKITDDQPLTYIHFISFLLLTAGTGGLLGGLLKGQIINFFGTIFFIGGLGVLTGMYLTLTIPINDKQV
ncbi:MAG TPA: hypothetical protein VI757_09025 [Bacteroidia bacterium]|nr:hypothetical protein [Bacteroidia bacterium]